MSALSGGSQLCVPITCASECLITDVNRVVSFSALLMTNMRKTVSGKSSPCLLAPYHHGEEMRHLGNSAAFEEKGSG